MSLPTSRGSLGFTGTNWLLFGSKYASRWITGRFCESGGSIEPDPSATAGVATATELSPARNDPRVDAGSRYATLVLGAKADAVKLSGVRLRIVAPVPRPWVGAMASSSLPRPPRFTAAIPTPPCPALLATANRSGFEAEVPR